jgi:hypothetical protein
VKTRATITLPRPVGPALADEADHEFAAWMPEVQWATWRNVRRHPTALACPVRLGTRRHACGEDDHPLCRARDDAVRRVMDHGAVYTRDRLVVVMVGQPYGLDGDTCDALGRLEAAGLTVFVQARSWHFPAHTLRVELWAPGVDPYNPEYPDPDAMAELRKVGRR